MADQELHQCQLRIDHVTTSVKRCRIEKDRLRLWKASVRYLVMELCCPAQFPGAFEPLGTDDLIGINSTVQPVATTEIPANPLEAFHTSLRRRCAAYRRRTKMYAKQTGHLQER